MACYCAGYVTHCGGLLFKGLHDDVVEDGVDTAGQLLQARGLDIQHCRANLVLRLDHVVANFVD